MTSPEPGLRVVFAGTPDFAAAILVKLLSAPLSVVAAYTQPDRPAGRGRKLKQSPVKTLAATRGIPVLQPSTLRVAEARPTLEGLRPDVMVVAAYGLLLPPAILRTPPLGCINVHASLLPRWRGAAPIQRAILAGDRETGISIMQMDEGLDTGPVLACQRCTLDERDTSRSVHDRLAHLGGELLVQTLARLQTGGLTASPQNDRHATLAPRIDKREALIDWSLAAVDLERRVRAFNPWPVAYTGLGGKRLRIWEAQARGTPATSKPGAIVQAGKSGIDVATGDGMLRLLRVQVAGGRIVRAADFLNAHRLEPGTILDDPTA